MATPVISVVNPHAPDNRQQAVLALPGEEDDLPQTFTGAAEPEHRPDLCGEARSSRRCSCVVSSTMPGKAGAAIWTI